MAQSSYGDSRWEAGMKARGRTRRWVWLFRNQPLTIRLLAAAAGLVTAAAAFGAGRGGPERRQLHRRAEPRRRGLRPAGQRDGRGPVHLPDGRPAGRELRRGRRERAPPGMSPQMARMFTTIAIQVYCPQEMEALTNGNLTGGLPQAPGMPGMPGSAACRRREQCPARRAACRSMPGCRATNRYPAGRWSTRCRPWPRDRGGGQEVDPLLRTTSSPARSSATAAAAPRPRRRRCRSAANRGARSWRPPTRKR